MPRNSLLLASLLAAAGTVAHAQTTPAGGNEAAGRAAVLGYAANMRGFPFYRCVYRYTHAEAPTVGDVLAVRWANARSYDNLLIVDGEFDRYESVHPQEPDRAAGGKGVPLGEGIEGVPAFFPTLKYLTNGQNRLAYVGGLRAINLFSGTSNLTGPEHPPLAMQFVGHRNERGPDVLLTQADEYEPLFDGLEDIGGRAAVTVRLKRRQLNLKGKEVALRFCFDPSRGYLPIRMAVLIEGLPVKEVHVTQARECSGGRWFPERVLAWTKAPQPGQPYSIDEIRVLELEADRRPAASDFTIDVPAGTSVLDRENYNGNFFKLRQNEKINVKDIPKLYRMLDQVKTTPRMDTAIPRPRSYRLVGLVGGPLLALAGAVAFVLLRRRRLRRSRAR